MQFNSRAFLALISSLPLAAAAEDAASILRTMGEKQIARWAGVERYTVDQSMMGNRMTRSFERFEVKGADGSSFPAFRLSGQRAASEQCAQFLDQYASGLEMFGDAHASEVERQMQAAGLPPGLLKATGSDPWATMDSRLMMNGMAVFARGAAQGERMRTDGSEDALAARQDMSEFAERARLVGKETVDGRDAFHLRAEGLDRTEVVDGQQFTFQTVSLWVDAAEYVPLRTRIEGVATADGQSRPVTIENLERDYRTVAGSRMYEPYARVMRMTGMLDDAQRAEMAKAQQQMAETERKLAQMPPAQRQMVMNQMGPQLEMMRSMATGGGFEMTTQVHEIAVNAPEMTADVPATPCDGQAAPGDGTVAAATSASPASADPEAVQQACLREKIREAQAAQQKKRGVGKLLGAVSRATSMFGSPEISQAMNQAAAANATVSDLADAARDLGIGEDEIRDCQDAD
jgi:hypothetical protein